MLVRIGLIFLMTLVQNYPNSGQKGNPGDFWLTMDPGYGGYYVTAFLQGYQFARLELGRELKGTLSEKRQSELQHESFEYLNMDSDQIAEGISELYRDYSNKHIRFSALVIPICKKINGTYSQEQLEEEIQFLRTVFK